MAKQRMISKVISVSDKVNELPEIMDALLFTWMIPHTDDFGRLGGTPSKVKGLVVPMRDDIKKEDVGRSLQRLADAGLILWYEAEGERVIQIVGFEKHQQGLHKRTRSQFPDPPAEHDELFSDFPGNSGNYPNIPSELNRTELNRTEQNGTEEKGREQELEPEAPSDCSRHDDVNLFRLFESEGFGTLSSVISDKIQGLERDYGNRWVAEAMKIAVFKGKRNLSFVTGILKNWKADGIDEPWSKEQQQVNKKGGGRGSSGKPEIAIVQQETGTEPDVTQEEYEELLRLAEELQGSKP